MFVGKDRRTLKLLHREEPGLTLYSKKLDDACFPKTEVYEEIKGVSYRMQRS